jgi:large subunit ribosomal protein L25
LIAGRQKSLIWIGGCVITVTCKPRETQKKGDNKRLRREGFIPFVVYSKGKTAESGMVLKTEIEAAMRSIRPGFLPTTLFSLKMEKGKALSVLAREVQYDPTSYAIDHLDFMELDEKTPVIVKVPVELTNTVDCIGVKLGGFLQYVMRHVKVRCLPKDIPSHFQVDVKELNIAQTRRVRDLVLPSGVTCLDSMDAVVVTIAKAIA